jgi:hypothetical protein
MSDVGTSGINFGINHSCRAVRGLGGYDAPLASVIELKTEAPE